jgi:hypothetical protein
MIDRARLERDPDLGREPGKAVLRKLGAASGFSSSRWALE